jgi:hypothetical protein
MNIKIIRFLAGLLFFTTLPTVVQAEETHRIPDAPPDYLEKVNPYDVGSILQDKKFIKKIGRLYKRKCQKCHGVRGDGNGPRAEGFIIKPVAFAQPGYLQRRRDGQLYWIIENGSPGTEMPAHGFGSRANFNKDEIWQVITFLRHKFTN